MTLALIAGRGDLPAVVYAASGGAIVCGYEGVALTGLEVDLTFRLETLGTLLVHLKARGVTEVCFAGGIDRPQIDPTRLDSATAPLVPFFMDALKKGDDGALGVVVDLFERDGFTVRGATEIAPDLLAKEGVYGDHGPDAVMRSDADVAAAHIRDLSPRDIGQACIVGQGRVIAMEDAGGTDALLDLSEARGQGAILFKGPKAHQSRLVDLPTVGPQTFVRAAAAGLRGVVVEADDVIVLDPAGCTAAADANGLVFWARPAE